MRKSWVTLGGAWLAGLLILTWQIWPTLSYKVEQEKSQREVAFLGDWEDLSNWARWNQEPVLTLAEKLKNVGVGALAASPDLSETDEAALRSLGFAIAWRSGFLPVPIDALLARFKSGDGLLSNEEEAPGFPGKFRDVTQMVRDHEGFLPVNEFSRQKGLATLAAVLPSNLIKMHVLGTAELLSPNPQLWSARLVRAVDARWVRLLYIRLSPALDFNGNLAFLDQTASRLEEKGFMLTRPTVFKWERSGGNSRSFLPLIIAVLTPVVALLFVRSLSIKSPVLSFLIVAFFSFAGGLAIQGLGVSAGTILGVSHPRGVKAALVLPLLLVFPFLLGKGERKEFLDKTLTVRHLVVGGGLGLLMLAFYLMRSGNFPLIPVSDSERVFRGHLESLFGARPRFKEFLIGHPLLIFGFYLAAQSKRKIGFLRDGRFWMWLGLLGQMSILNTFTHYQTPLMQSVMRTFHGLWLGILVSVPVCYLSSKFKAST